MPDFLPKATEQQMGVVVPATSAQISSHTKLDPNTGARLVVPNDLYSTNGSSLLDANGALLIPNIAAPGSPNQGDMYIDTSDNSLNAYYSGMTNHIVSSIFDIASSLTVSNTVTETDLLTSATVIGTAVLPVNYLKQGRHLRVRVFGFYSCTGSPTIRVRIRLGGLTGTIINDTGVSTIGPNISNAGFSIESDFTCYTAGATGTVTGQGGVFLFHGSTNRQAFDIVSTSPVTIDTTTSQRVTISLQWGTADPANTLTVTNGYIEVFI